MASETENPQGITWSDNACEIFAAIARAQANMGVLKATKTAKVKPKQGDSWKEYSYKYAGLPDTLVVSLPAFNAEGIAVMQPTAAFNSGAEVRTMFAMAGEDGKGQWVLGPAIWISSKPGAQDIGSAITYARRYSLQPMVGVSPADDDGRAAQDSAPEEWTRRETQPRRGPVDPREGQPRCSGRAAGLASGNVERTIKLATFEGEEPASVWRRVCEGLKLPPDFLGHGPECPKAERLTPGEGQAVRKVLDAAVAAHTTEREPGEDRIIDEELPF